MSSPPSFLSFAADLKLNSNNRVVTPIQSPFLSPFPSSPSSPGVEPRRTKSRHMDAFSFFDSKAPPQASQHQQQQGQTGSQAVTGNAGLMHAPGSARSMTPLQSPYGYDQGGQTPRWEAPGAFNSTSSAHQSYASAHQQQPYPTSHPQQQSFASQQHQHQQQHAYAHHQSVQQHQHQHYPQSGYPPYNNTLSHHSMHAGPPSGFRSGAPIAPPGQQRPSMARGWTHASGDPLARDMTPLVSPAPLTPGIGTVIGDDGDEVISTAVVVKNIPFSLKKETLLELFDQLTLPKPYAFNYHFDNGTFRGLAFANFHSPEETQHVIGALNGYELIGRKLRVEYKKVLPADQRERIELQKRQKAMQEEAMLGGIMRPSSAASYSSAKAMTPALVEKPKLEIDLNDPATLQIYSSLLLFRDDTSPGAQKQMAFPPEFSPPQRRTVHLIAQKLGLAHLSRGEGDERYVLVSKPTTDNSATAEQPSRSVPAPIGSQTVSTTQQALPALRIDTKQDLKPRTSYGNGNTLPHLQPASLKQMKSYGDLRQPSPLRTSAALSGDAFGNGGGGHGSSGASSPALASPAPGYFTYAGSVSAGSPMLAERLGEMSLGGSGGPTSAPLRQPKGPEPQRAFLGRSTSLRSVTQPSSGGQSQ